MTGRRWPAGVLGDHVLASLRDADVDVHFADYSTAVAAARGLPVELSRDAPVDALVERLDALVLTGGADVDPARYGRQREAGCGAVEPERDAWELALLDAAIRHGLPVLGICRGLQLLNVACGGTLVQDVEEGPAGGRHMRADVAPHEPVHTVKLVPGTRAAWLYGEEVKVNSLHHQAIDELGAGLLASGHSPDGTVEAVEMPGAAVLGVQWHPEWMRAHPEAGFSWLVAQAGNG